MNASTRIQMVHVYPATGLARRGGHCTCGWLGRRRRLASLAKLDALEHAACNAHYVGYPLALNVVPRTHTTNRSVVAEVLTHGARS